MRNDEQIDVLLRRHASKAAFAAAGEHLDADEMSSFAEGSLPAAAKGRYTLHLAECSDCRRQVTRLALSAGSAPVETVERREPLGRGFWQTFAGLFAMPALRYAAFAAVLLVIAGIGFIAFRRPSRPESLVASRTTNDQHPPAAVGETYTDRNVAPGYQERTTPTPQITGRADDRVKSEASTPAVAAAPAAPLKEVAEVPLVVSEKKAAAEPEAARMSPAYAPPPPGEARPKGQIGGAGVLAQAPQKAEPVDRIAAARERSEGFMKDESDADKRAIQARSVAQNRAANEKLKGPSRNLDQPANRNITGNRDASTTTSDVAKADVAEEEQTRSISGRKFKRQGNTWVDQKFKPSMSLKRVARGSDDFKDLDSGLRSIAQQVSGEIIVVWKGRAYLIK